MINKSFMQMYVENHEERTGKKWCWDMLAIVQCKPSWENYTVSQIVMLDPQCDISIYNRSKSEWEHDVKLCDREANEIYAEFVCQTVLREANIRKAQLEHLARS